MKRKTIIIWIGIVALLVTAIAKLQQVEQGRLEKLHEKYPALGESTTKPEKEIIEETAVNKDTVTQDGPIKNYFVKSKLLAESGMVKNGVKESQWQYYSHKNYLLSIIHYSNGKRHGQCLFFNRDSIIIKKIHYKQGKLNGDAIDFYENGAIKQKVKYLGNRKEGNQIKYYRNGMVAEQAGYEGDELNGYLLTYDDEGFMNEKVEYENGEKHGVWISYDYTPAKKIHYKSQEGYYSKGLKNGLYKYYDYYYDLKNKTLGSKLILTGAETFKDDELHGKYFTYDPEEGFLLIETNYSNGLEHGIRKSYCPHGPDKGKLYIVQEIIDGKGQKRTYNCECPYPN